MKKSELRELIKEVIGGYSKYTGKTKGGTSDEFMQILTKIAKERPEDEEKDDIDSSPLPHEEDSIHEDVGALMSLEGLIEYISGLQSDVEVFIPRIFPGGFGVDETVRRKPQQAIVELSKLLKSPKHLSAEFELIQDNPKFKKISLVVSDEEMKSRERIVKGAGSLD